MKEFLIIYIIGMIIVIFGSASISILLIITATVALSISDKFQEAVVPDLILKIFGAVIMFLAGVAWVHESEPAAIDVYRGRTTLEITYQDSIPVDSTVVWKKSI